MAIRGWNSYWGLRTGMGHGTVDVANQESTTQRKSGWPLWSTLRGVGRAAEIQLGHFDPERVVRFSLTQIWNALNPGWPLWSISQNSASRLHHQKWISKSVNQN